MKTIKLTNAQIIMYDKLMGQKLTFGLSDSKAEKETINEMINIWDELSVLKNKNVKIIN